MRDNVRLARVFVVSSEEDVSSKAAPFRDQGGAGCQERVSRGGSMREIRREPWWL